MITAMTVALSFLILTAPFAVAVALSWAAHRSHSLRMHLDQFRMAAPMAGRFFDTDRADDRDSFRVQHDADAIRTRFERSPAWPVSGALGERR
jgi:hypothetical protein